jgi:hypothetical protein
MSIFEGLGIFLEPAAAAESHNNMRERDDLMQIWTINITQSIHGEVQLFTLNVVLIAANQ